MVSLFLYSVFCIFLTPVIIGWLYIRRMKGKEDKKRFNERFGKASLKRPNGLLIWMHGASVGECLSMMPLIHKLLRELPAAHIMVTSGTVTSAELIAKRLPDRAFHQYIPVDLMHTTNRFITHWHPDMVLWFESEFWPHLLYKIAQKKIPLVLLNGRISDRSFKRWQRARWIIQPILNLFTLAFGQSELDADRLKILGASHALYKGNLKYAAGDPVFNQQELDKLTHQIGDRPCWCGGSTHDNEEEMLADIHLSLKDRFKNPLFVSAPRHPNRADTLENLFLKKGLTVARRSRNEPITPETDVYLSDTIGEMGLIYQLTPLVFVGGSLIKFGGQNMLEPMRLKRVVFVGPYPFNFKEIIQRSLTQKALIQVKNTDELKEKIIYYLSNPSQQADLMTRAFQTASSELAVLDRIYQTLAERTKLFS